MSSIIYPEWTGADPASGAWNTCTLGGVTLPGICKIEEVPCAVRVDTKTAKGADSPTSTDNGIESSKFIIDQWINASMWPATQLAIGQINPRRPGRERAPVQIVHPQANVTGIASVRITKLIVRAPTARGGMHLLWHVEEWFDKPKAVAKPKTNKAVEAKNNAAYNAVNLDQMRVEALERNRKEALKDMNDSLLDDAGKPLSPSDPSNLKQSMFVGNPNAEGS